LEKRQEEESNTLWKAAQKELDDLKARLMELECKRLTNHTADIVRDVVSRRLTKVHQPSHSMSSWFSRSDASSGIQWLAPSICS
jgi:hypothetical protein